MQWRHAEGVLGADHAGVGVDEFLQSLCVVQAARRVDVVGRSVGDEQAGDLQARVVSLGHAGWRDGFVQGRVAALAVALDRQGMVLADAVSNEQFGHFREAALRGPVHEREVVRPADVGLLDGDAGGIRDAGLEHRPQRVLGTCPSGFVQDVVGVRILLEGDAVGEQLPHRRTAAALADGDDEQALSDPLQHVRMLGQQRGHAGVVRRTVPAFRVVAQRRPDEGGFDVVQSRRLRMAHEPIVAELSQRSVHSLHPQARVPSRS